MRGAVSSKGKRILISSCLEVSAECRGWTNNIIQIGRTTELSPYAQQKRSYVQLKSDLRGYSGEWNHVGCSAPATVTQNMALNCVNCVRLRSAGRSVKGNTRVIREGWPIQLWRKGSGLGIKREGKFCTIDVSTRSTGWNRTTCSHAPKSSYNPKSNQSDNETDNDVREIIP